MRIRTSPGKRTHPTCFSHIRMTPRESHPSSEGRAVQTCNVCQTQVDVSGKEPLEEVPCPRCRQIVTVRGSIGGYRLASIAGRGGMGIVYKAFDPGLKRNVALKLLRREDSHNQSLIEQLAEEAAVTATVNHQNVVRVFSTGTDGDRFFI